MLGSNSERPYILPCVVKSSFKTNHIETPVYLLTYVNWLSPFKSEISELKPGGVGDLVFYFKSCKTTKLFSSRRNWDSPNPSPAGEYARPPLVPGGGAHSLWLERGWESPNSDEGTYTEVLCIYVYVLYVKDLLCISWTQ